MFLSSCTTNICLASEICSDETNRCRQECYRIIPLGDNKQHISNKNPFFSEIKLFMSTHAAVKYTYVHGKYTIEKTKWKKVFMQKRSLTRSINSYRYNYHYIRLKSGKERRH